MAISEDELLKRMACSMARSMEVEGADYERMKKILLEDLETKDNK